VTGTLAQIQNTLDALAAAARAGDLSTYRTRLQEAELVGLTPEQIHDSYHWGRRGMGAADFDHRGRIRSR